MFVLTVDQRHSRGRADKVDDLLGWFAALVTARMPTGFRNVGAWSLRYGAQLNAYLWLLTDRYPYSGPGA